MRRAAWWAVAGASAAWLATAAAVRAQGTGTSAGSGGAGQSAAGSRTAGPSEPGVPASESAGARAPGHGTASAAPGAGTSDQGVATGEIEGKVASVDKDAHALTLAGGRKLSVDPSAQVTKDGKPSSFAAIKQGDDVRASFAPGKPGTVEKILSTSSTSSK